MESSAFEYDLPDEAIAQTPASPRDSSRLLVTGDPVEHRHTRDFPSLLGPGDVVVVNNTRVLSARMHLTKATGGQVEVLALEPVEDGRWEALVRPSRRVPEGTTLHAADGTAVLRVDEATGEGTRLVQPLGGAMEQTLEVLGAVPLPPYITAPLGDTERYQTVFADHATSVAAPTAGLHLTDAVLTQCQERGAQIRTVELSVGVGTFRPLESDVVDEHTMHSERYRVDATTWADIESADRVVAVGTTVVRALESVARSGELAGRTDLFITPGFEFRVVDALMTNFHVPRSTLLVMIEAFAGPRWRDWYGIALAEGYRFLSFGDAMFLERPS